MESHSKDNHTTHSRLDSLELHDKVFTVTFMLETFMKDMKGMVVEEVTVEEEPIEKEKEVSKEEEATQEGKKAEEEEKDAEEEENPKEIVATPIKEPSPPLVETTPITTSPGNPRLPRRGGPGPGSNFIFFCC